MYPLGTSVEGVEPPGRAQAPEPPTVAHLERLPSASETIGLLDVLLVEVALHQDVRALAAAVPDDDVRLAAIPAPLGLELRDVVGLEGAEGAVDEGVGQVGLADVGNLLAAAGIAKTAQRLVVSTAGPRVMGLVFESGRHALHVSENYHSVDWPRAPYGLRWPSLIIHGIRRPIALFGVSTPVDGSRTTRSL